MATMATAVTAMTPIAPRTMFTALLPSGRPSRSALCFDRDVVAEDGLLDVGTVPLGLPAGLADLPEDRDDRGEDDDGDHREQVAVDAGDGLAEDEPEGGDPHGPEEAADDVVGDEGAVLHAPDAGHDRGERAHDRDEAGQHDGLGPVLLEVVLGLLDVLLL